MSQEQSLYTTVVKGLGKPVYWRSNEYMDYVSRQPSDYSGLIGYYPHTGERSNDPHHYRKGSKGGIALKPSDVWIISLTHEEHILAEAGEIHLDEVMVMKAALKHLNNYLYENKIK